jgi:hypothetical protein
VQTLRQVIIADVEGMAKYALSKYILYRKAVEKVNSPPTRLIFYRGTSIPVIAGTCQLIILMLLDGVSEGQFKIVLEEGMWSPLRGGTAMLCCTAQAMWFSILSYPF